MTNPEADARASVAGLTGLTRKHLETFARNPHAASVAEVREMAGELLAASVGVNADARRISELKMECETIRREAWMAGYRRADEQWSEEHPCCRSLLDDGRDEDYREWRAAVKAKEAQE